MTNQEYNSAYRKARKGFQRVMASERKAIKKVFKAAADETAALVRTLELAGRSELTIQSQALLELQLLSSAGEIAEATARLTEDAVTNGYNIYLKVDAEYMADAAIQAGAEGFITSKGLESMGQAVNNRLITEVVRGLYIDGLTFSERVWNAGALFDKSIQDVVSTGLANNRDLFKIAKDIQVYTKDGRVALMKRYGSLEAGTKAFKKRIPKNVDWRAVRLVRSELYSAMQRASVQQGELNPGSNGLYDWILMPGLQHDCICIDYAKASPYKVEDIPAYPHPNCGCSAVPKLRPQGELVADLKAFVRGDDSPRIETWYNNIYLPAQFNA